MGLSASQGRLLLLTARRSDLEFRAQQISHKRLMLAQELENIALDYEKATTNKQMKIELYVNGNTDNQATKQTVNLTYARLVSGALSLKNSGLKRSATAGTDDDSLLYKNTHPCRLVDADGNIVVSSEDEIPGATNSPTIYYKQKTSTGANTSLAGLLSKKDTVVETSQNNVNVVRINGKIYDLSTGEEKLGSLANTPNWKKTEGAVYQPLGANETRSQYIDNTTKNNKNGYVVDEALQGGKNDPNYLQDMIRNGIYSIQRAYPVEGEEGQYTWSNVAWESMSNLYDTNYKDDDEAAQAKYDRLQNEIQNEDKQLELELDNIETQRSAVTTEIESVQKVIDDNIESTFKIFS